MWASGGGGGGARSPAFFEALSGWPELIVSGALFYVTEHTGHYHTNHTKTQT